MCSHATCSAYWSRRSDCDAPVVQPSGSAATHVEPRQRARETRPELAEPRRRTAPPCRSSPHQPSIATVTIARRWSGRCPGRSSSTTTRRFALLCRVNLELDGFAVQRGRHARRGRGSARRRAPRRRAARRPPGQRRYRRPARAIRADGIPVARRHRLGRRQRLPGRSPTPCSAKPFDPRLLVELARRLARVGP